MDEIADNALRSKLCPLRSRYFATIKIRGGHCNGLLSRPSVRAGSKGLPNGRDMASPTLSGPGFGDSREVKCGMPSP